MTVPREFADFCCELLSGLGQIQARRMFGGWGLSVDGLNVAIVADLGDGDTLWLKADNETLRQFEAAGCRRFTYPMRRGDTTLLQSMNYYSAPEDAMDATHAMAPWARLALQTAMAARAHAVPGKPRSAPKPVRKTARPRQG